MLKYWMAGMAGAAVLAAAPLAAQAAPASNAFGLRSGDASMFEKAAYRRCWWRDGRRHCRRVEVERRPRVYGYRYYYGRPRPEDFPTGSTEWWRAMDYEGRGGHGRTP